MGVESRVGTAGGKKSNGKEEGEWVLFDMSLNGTGRKLRRQDEDNWEYEANYSSPEGSARWIRGIADGLFQRCRRKCTRSHFDGVPADGLRTTSVDLLIFYLQMFFENQVAITAMDKIMEEFFSLG